MKARVKATGEIVEVHTSDNADFEDKNGKYYWEYELFFGSLDIRYDDPDYWTRLEHQYAGMAMQGILSNPESELDYKGDETLPQAVAGCAAKLAHALIQKLKSSDL